MYEMNIHHLSTNGDLNFKLLEAIKRRMDGYSEIYQVEVYTGKVERNGFQEYMLAVYFSFEAFSKKTPMTIGAIVRSQEPDCKVEFHS